MILKPLIRKEKSDEIVKPNILPVSESIDRYEWETIESTQYLELTGRLMMLTIMQRERSVKFNKSNHERLYGKSISHSSWPLCKCNYAKYIRGTDLGLNWEVIKNLRGVL